MDGLVFYLLLGAIAGVMAGLLGIGGGLVIVPALTWFFDSQGVAPEILLHKAIATSLAVIAVSSLASTYAHHLRGTIQWRLFTRLAPSLSLGALLGAWLAESLSSDTLRICFSVFEIAIALYLGFDKNPSAQRKLPGTLGLSVIGATVGVISALVGVGGGTLIVPLFLLCNVPVRDAISTSAALAFPIALSGSLGFLFFGAVSATADVAHSSYIDWQAFAFITLASILFVPLGARLAHALPTATLKKAFAVLLAVIGLLMLIS